MGRYHSDLMKTLFPNQRPTGIDLGNVEIKEARNRTHKFTMKPGDHRAEFILFYDWLEDIYLLWNTKEMPMIRNKRAFSTNQIRKYAYFATKDLSELMPELETIIKNKSYLGWIETPQKATEEPIHADSL